MKPPPQDWPRISTAIYYENTGEAIDWLCNAFGFEIRQKILAPDGKTIVHSELVMGGGMIMVGSEKADFPYRKYPKVIGGVNTQNMMVYIDDCDAHCERARKAGATIVKEPETVDYGPEYWSDRGYECIDLGGHHWWFYQRLRDRP